MKRLIMCHKNLNGTQVEFTCLKKNCRLIAERDYMLFTCNFFFQTSL